MNKELEFYINEDGIACIPLKDYNDSLEEIAELKAKLEMYENGVYYSSENDKLQDRIDKAVEYIKKSMNNPQPFYEYLFGDENGKVENLDKLLNILNGEE